MNSRDKSNILHAIPAVLAITFYGAMIIGYVMNLYKLTQCDFVAPYKCEVLHGVGVVPPIGGFVGWMSIE